MRGPWLICGISLQAHRDICSTPRHDRNFSRTLGRPHKVDVQLYQTRHTKHGPSIPLLCHVADRVPLSLCTQSYGYERGGVGSDLTTGRTALVPLAFARDPISARQC